MSSQLLSNRETALERTETTPTLHLSVITSEEDSEDKENQPAVISRPRLIALRKPLRQDSICMPSEERSATHGSEETSDCSETVELSPTLRQLALDYSDELTTDSNWTIPSPEKEMKDEEVQECEDNEWARVLVAYQTGREDFFADAESSHTTASSDSWTDTEIPCGGWSCVARRQDGGHPPEE
jgi:hypothetical protein